MCPKQIARIYKFEELAQDRLEKEQPNNKIRHLIYTELEKKARSTRSHTVCATCAAQESFFFLVNDNTAYTLSCVRGAKQQTREIAISECERVRAIYSYTERYIPVSPECVRSTYTQSVPGETIAHMFIHKVLPRSKDT